MSEVPLYPEAASPRSRPWDSGLSLIVALCISQEGTVDPERLDMLRQMVKTGSDRKAQSANEVCVCERE